MIVFQTLVAKQVRDSIGGAIARRTCSSLQVDDADEAGFSALLGARSALVVAVRLLK
jgi:hypothetical protein